MSKEEKTKYTEDWQDKLVALVEKEITQEIKSYAKKRI